MEEVIKAWTGWRLEFEQEYGSDMDGATEYRSYSTFDWTTDLGEIIRTNKMKWVNYKHGPREYSQTYIEEATVNEIKVHFTCGYAITLTKKKLSYQFNYCFGHGDYRDRIALIPPGVKDKEIAKYENK